MTEPDVDNLVYEVPDIVGPYTNVPKVGESVTLKPDVAKLVVVVVICVSKYFSHELKFILQDDMFKRVSVKTVKLVLV